MRLLSLIVGDLLLLLALVFLGILFTALVYEIIFPNEARELSLNTGIHFLMIVTLLTQGIIFQIGSINPEKSILKLFTVFSSIASLFLFLVGVVTVNLNWWIRPVESLLDINLPFATPLSILLLVVLVFLVPFSLLSVSSDDKK
ncbi:hypothetical protein [Kosmotoga sp.]|uniref:hypothetical protein n=1 Tax=Kosmotoga sp. TaxID=1955248 RepID=UPI002585802A|nr:hypothetical protein [Kosmotoga sp.]